MLLSVLQLTLFYCNFKKVGAIAVHFNSEDFLRYNGKQYRFRVEFTVWSGIAMVQINDGCYLNESLISVLYDYCRNVMDTYEHTGQLICQKVWAFNYEEL